MSRTAGGGVAVKRAIGWALGWILGLLVAGCASKPAVRSAGDMWLPEAGVELPSQRIQDFFLVEALIDGKGPYRLLLDTGADFITLDSQLSSEFRGVGTPAVERLHGATGNAVTISAGATIPEMTLGAFCLMEVPVLFSNIAPLGTTLGLPLDGLLGCGVFAQTTLEVDYLADVVRVHRRSLPNPDSDGSGHVMDMSYRHLPEVRASLGEAPATLFLVDSGCGWAMALPESVDDGTLVPGSIRMRDSLTISGRQTRAEGAIAAPVRLGPHTLRRVYAVVGSGRPKLGAPLLQNFRVVFDFPNQRVAFYPR